MQFFTMGVKLGYRNNGGKAPEFYNKFLGYFYIILGFFLWGF